jgi:hypothetical protein
MSSRFPFLGGSRRSVSRNTSEFAPLLDENGEELPSFVYGRFDMGYRVSFAGLAISVKKEGGLYHYHREFGRWSRSADIAADEKTGLVIHPIEPLYMPDAVTEYLEIRFGEVIIGPEDSTEIFLNFPVEFGIFVETGGKTEVIDVFTLKYPKYSLYGTASRGIITRWYQSGTYSSPPLSRNFKEGILRLTIENKSAEWVAVSRVIIFDKGMQLYFDEHIVSMEAGMVIGPNGTAEVTAIDRPLHEGMMRAHKMYKPRKNSAFSNIPGAVAEGVFTMDSGLR